ncbi:MAG TPA: glycosyltransferase [Bacilli bacterium]
MGRRILWLTTAYPSKADPTQGILFKTQVDAIVRLGAEVKVVAPTPWMPLFMEGSANKGHGITSPQYTDGMVKVYRPRYLDLPIRKTWNLPYHIWIRRQIEALRLPKPDLIHAHSAYPMGVLAQQLGAFWNIPTVLSLYNDDVNSGRFPAASQNLKRLNEALIHNTSIIAVSESIAEQTKKISKRDPAVMPMGIPLSGYGPLLDKNAARRKLKLPPDRFIVLFVGALTENQGVRELLRSLSQLKEEGVMGVFAGEGPLEEEVKSLPHAVAAGRQSPLTISSYLAAADVLVSPAYPEEYPTILIEAGAAGLPIIATNEREIPELLADHRGTCIFPQSAELLTHAIRTIMKDYKQALGHADRLRDYVHQHHDADKHSQRLAQLYESLILHRSRVMTFNSLQGGGVHES